MRYRLLLLFAVAILALAAYAPALASFRWRVDNCPPCPPFCNGPNTGVVSVSSQLYSAPQGYDIGAMGYGSESMYPYYGSGAMGYGSPSMYQNYSSGPMMNGSSYPPPYPINYGGYGPYGDPRIVPSPTVVGGTGYVPSLIEPISPRVMNMTTDANGEVVMQPDPSFQRVWVPPLPDFVTGGRAIYQVPNEATVYQPMPNGYCPNCQGQGPGPGPRPTPY